MLKWRATMGGKVVASRSAPLALGSIGKPNVLIATEKIVGTAVVI